MFYRDHVWSFIRNLSSVIPVRPKMTEPWLCDTDPSASKSFQNTTTLAPGYMVIGYMVFSGYMVNFWVVPISLNILKIDHISRIGPEFRLYGQFFPGPEVDHISGSQCTYLLIHYASKTNLWTGFKNVLSQKIVTPYLYRFFQRIVRCCQPQPKLSLWYGLINISGRTL